MYRVFGLLALLLVAETSFAAESPWSSEIELGAVVTTGNTEDRNIKFLGDTVRDGELYKHNVHLDVLNSSSDGTKTAQKNYLYYQADRKLEGNHSLFARFAYEDDKFSGYDYQTDVTAGYTRQFIKDDAQEFRGAIGLGYRQSELELGGSEDEMILRLAANYKRAIGDNANFAQALSVEVGEFATISRSTTSLSANIAGDLAMKLALNIKNTSEVPAGRDKTDTETSVTIVYKF